MRITYLPHARRRMEERGISEEEVETVLEAPALEYLGNLGRTVAEPILPGRRLEVKVVCNLSAGARESSSPWSWVGPRVRRARKEANSGIQIRVRPRIRSLLHLCQGR
jgi:hypothetical protein